MKKLKTLSVALAMTMVVGTGMPAAGVSATVPAITTTVEAATKKLSLNASGTKAYVGKAVKLNVKATKGAKLSYKTSNKGIATVNSRGVVTGKKAGTVKITITAKKSKYKTVKKTVTVKVSKQNQKITADNIQLTPGQSRKLGAKARTKLTYKSSNTKVVTVDKNGNLKAKGIGTAKITISAPANGTYNKASRTITVKVAKAAPKPTQPVATPKPTTPAKPTETPKPATPAKPTETPKPTEPAKPTETPKPTEPPAPTEPPKPTEAPKPTETPKPDVSYVTDMYFDETSKTNTIYIGEPKSSTLKWTATGNTTLKDFVFTSSDPSIATVDENGTITGIKAGDVRITATSKTPFAAGGGEADCLSASYKYHVKTQYNEDYADGVGFKDPENVDKCGRNVGIGETINPNKGLSKYSPEKAEKYLTFSSSDPSVATIDAQGNITGVSKGYVTFTVKTKYPVEETGQYYKEASATYHVGDYTYEEILDGLTVDMEASRTAHDVLNDMRQHKSSRPAISQGLDEVPAREWSDSKFQEAAVRASRNIICEILNCWTDMDQKSDINPLATHGYGQNGYGGDGWETTGAALGRAADTFFYDLPHAQNQTRASDKYSAVAVVQYKNAAGINLTSMITDMSGYSYEEEVANIAQSNKVNGGNLTWLEAGYAATLTTPEQYLDICKHFGLTWGMENSASAQSNDYFDNAVGFSDGSNLEATTEDIDISADAESSTDDDSISSEISIDTDITNDEDTSSDINVDESLLDSTSVDILDENE